MVSLFLALSIFAPAPKPAEPPVATVSLTLEGTERKLTGSLGTQWEGIGLALLGSSSVVSDKTEADWEAAGKADHLRVRFPTPRAIKARGEPKDATYEVSELLIHMNGWSIRGLSIRCGEKFYAFGKYDGALWVTVGREFLPIP